MRDMHHDNINQFLGASIESDRVLIVTKYAVRGSLEVSMKFNFDILVVDDEQDCLNCFGFIEKTFVVVRSMILAVWFIFRMFCWIVQSNWRHFSFSP